MLRRSRSSCDYQFATLIDLGTLFYTLFNFGDGRTSFDQWRKPYFHFLSDRYTALLYILPLEVMPNTVIFGFWRLNTFAAEYAEE